MASTIFRSLHTNPCLLHRTALLRRKNVFLYCTMRSAQTQTATTQEKVKSQVKVAPNVQNKTLEKASKDYEAVIAVEAHVQLNTLTKAFCSCPYNYGSPPNTSVCPICMGLPGALAVLNMKVIGLQLKWDFHSIAKWHSTQRLIGNSTFTWTFRRVDLNRAGVPLLEIVSETDMRTGIEAAELQRLVRYLEVAEFFDTTITKGADVKLATNWIMGDVAAHMKNEKLTINEIKLSPQELAELIASIKDGTFSGKIGKEIVDPAEIEKMVEKVVSENPKQLEQCHGGKTKLQDYFAGQVMKLSKGKANPGLLNKILLEKLNAKS
ncbi:hypothetical protein C1H46_004773 [Malus baccata]|uniref:Asn/Gln amidotransferase domain-containing protein n=1 Tax=Malus baccata TaxID=106549 RepID=A0A540NES6_MALBA|nr:hypothetical protein C1H46_004773 [Malus baccata]